MSIPIPQWQQNPNELIPAVVQDYNTSKVLMLGYMNLQAYVMTKDSNKVTFWSRSKKRLWQKGETSGNVLVLKNIYVDCDADTLLVQAEPLGPTCHTGTKSCFTEDELAIETLGELIRTIRQRSTSTAKQSYTKRLLEGGIESTGAKVLEESEELVRAAESEGKLRVAEEAADLLYHTLVLLEQQGVLFNEISEVLKERRG